ncbi:MAG: beta-ketoacyl-ACP synthase II, partial [Planctomycetes bacterium]|nr:beta-ketoacyl-ACP synthase II [Planctomycetota bacterium]
MSKRRVVVTGIGVCTPLGLDKQLFFDSLLQGKSGVRKIDYFDTTNFDVTFAAQVGGYKEEEWFDSKEIKRLDRFCQYALISAKQAIRDANIDSSALSKEQRNRIGVIMGSGIGGLKEMQNAQTTLLQRGPRRLSPLFVPKMISDSASGLIAIYHGFRGPNFVTVSACASSNHAMGMAMKLIQYGDADVIVTGGTEAAVTELGVAGFSCIGALSRRNDAPEKASRPFEKNRNGFVLGEGSAVVVFEELEYALKRGAHIYAEVLGFGQSDDAYHITAPDPEAEGPAMAITNALENAGIKPEQIDYINAHGTSTELNDKVETLAVKKVFGQGAYKIPISSTKSMIGHLLGAAAAVEFVATIMSINSNRIHPTINYEEPDPECDLDYVPNQMREHQVNIAISNSFGFGGHNSC